jgi:CorA-like Mg2+ transporter protein
MAQVTDHASGAGLGGPSGADVPCVRCACVTTWPVADEPAVALKALADPEEVALLDAALGRDVPVWVEFELVGDTEWFEPTIEPWEQFDRPEFSWEDALPESLRLKLESDSATDSFEKTLAVLPLIYTLGVRRARDELDGVDGVALFPAMGFQRPPDARPGPTRIHRIGAAVLDRYVLTLRLPDRAWPDRSAVVAEAQTTLSVPERFIPAGGEPKAEPLAQAIGFHQAATCGAVVARARQALRAIEQGFLQPSGPEDEENANSDDDDPLGPEALRTKFRELYSLGVGAEELERQLARLCTSFDDPADKSISSKIKPRFDEALAAVRSFQGDLRQAIDGIGGVVASQQFAIADAQQKVVSDQQEASDKFQRRATIVGSAVLIPALVAGVFGANVYVPGKDEPRGLVAMLLFMVALGVGTWWAIVSLDHPETRLPKWPQDLKAAHAHVYAGFVIACLSLAFGVLAVTPAVSASLKGGDAALGIVGSLLCACGAGLSLWCVLNWRSPQNWWTKRITARFLTKAGCLAGPFSFAFGGTLVATWLL